MREHVMFTSGNGFIKKALLNGGLEGAAVYGNDKQKLTREKDVCILPYSATHLVHSKLGLCRGMVSIRQRAVMRFQTELTWH